MLYLGDNRIQDYSTKNRPVFGLGSSFGEPQGSPGATLKGAGTIVKVSPTTENFGNVKVEATSGPLTVTVTNLGTTQDLTTSSITTTAPQASDFTIDSSSTCPTASGVLPHGSSCSIVLKAKPSALGTRKATLVITDVDGGSTEKVILTVVGI